MLKLKLCLENLSPNLVVFASIVHSDSPNRVTYRLKRHSTYCQDDVETHNDVGTKTNCFAVVRGHLRVRCHLK